MDRWNSLNPTYGQLPTTPQGLNLHLLEQQDPMAKPATAPPTGNGSAENTPQSTKKKEDPSGFLDSFMSFVHGKKPETLASVWSTPGGAKPALPKYIPEVKKTVVPEPAKETSSLVKPAVGQTTIDRQPEAKAAGGSSIPLIGGQNSSRLAAVKAAEVISDDSSNDAGLNSNNKRGQPSQSPVKAKFGKGRRGGKKNASDEEDDDDYVSEGSGSQDSNPQPPVKKSGQVAARERSTRKAKDKVEQKRRTSKGKTMYADDSDEDTSIEEVEEVQSVNSSEKDYDSDKDPAWRPSKEKEKQPSAKRARTNSGSEDDYGVRGRRRGRGRGRPPATFVNPIRTIPVISPVIPVAAPVRAATIPVAIPGRSPAVSVTPQGPPTVYVADPNDPHTFQKGDFVIHRQDLNDFKAFPIWKIDTGRLLQKFEAFERDGKLIHKALTTYSSWSDSIQKNYKAIGVRFLSTARGQEIVEVLDKYKPQPPDPGLDGLRDPFNVYIQILVSQSLEPTFLSALLQEPDPYYIEPLEKIDSVIEESSKKMRDSLKWTDTVVSSLNKMASFKMAVSAPSSDISCQATEKGVASHVVKLFGTVYDTSSLEVLSEVDENDATEYSVSMSVSEVLPFYHALRHVKLSLFKKCQARVAELRVDDTVQDSDVLDQCLQNSDWMQLLFLQLTEVVEQASKSVA